MTDDIAAWLTAIWDEDETVAKAATEGPWKWQDPGPPHKMALLGDNGRLMIVPSRTPDVYPSVMNARFMEANHPGAVLARIAADRQILAEHSRNAGRCGTCVHDVSVEYGDPVLTYYEPYCPTVRLLALPHAARPGYDEAWRP